MVFSGDMRSHTSRAQGKQEDSPKERADASQEGQRPTEPFERTEEEGMSPGKSWILV